MNLLSTRHYLKQAQAIITRELFSSDQLQDDAIDDAIVLRTDQLDEIAQRILTQLMSDQTADQSDEINAWSVDDE